MRRPALHDRLALLALIGGLPALVAALLLLDDWFRDPPLYWTAAGGLLLFWLAAAWYLRRRLLYRLRTAANLVTALREGDLSFRGRGGPRDGGHGSLMAELNELADALREQRLGEMETVVLLRNMLGEIDVVVLAFDDGGRLRMLNEAAERLLGLNEATAMGREAGDLGLAVCLEGEPERTLTLDLPGGSGRWELRRGGYRHFGRPRKLVTLSDVSRALRAEELAAWKRLIRVMSHELNNSLAPIRSLAGSLDRLVESEPRPEGWREDLRTGLRVIGSRAESLNSFLGAYAELAKMPEPRPEPLEVGPLVRRVAGLESRLTVELLPGPKVTLHADRAQVEQLLINLVKNAVDASLESGGGVRVGWEVTTHRLVIRVLDEGPGLAETANLFVPFYSTRPGGTGIGLVLCRQIAEAHGGSVSLENRTDRAGCEARVLLPLRPSLDA